MHQITDEKFEQIVAEAIDDIPKPYSDHLQNVAFILEDEPTEAQRKELKLSPYESLFGLYEGAPLPARDGRTKLLPDKITLFKKPLLSVSKNEQELKKQVRHTIWHEVAHYFGLDHSRIHELSRKPKRAEP